MEVSGTVCRIKGVGGGALAKKRGYFLLHFGRWGVSHDITKSADSQTNENFSDNDCMTVDFYKNVYQTDNSRLRISGNKKVFEKTQIGWWQMLVASQQFSVTVVKIYTADLNVF